VLILVYKTDIFRLKKSIFGFTSQASLSHLWDLFQTPFSKIIFWGLIGPKKLSLASLGAEKLIFEKSEFLYQKRS